MKRVRWPKKDEFFPSVGVVLVVTIIASLLLFVEDLASQTLVDWLRDAFASLRG